MKFRSDVDGYICGVRFYKFSTNTGTHVGSLWSTDGQLLARATFADETASGWQQVKFAKPFSDPVVVANPLNYASATSVPLALRFVRRHGIIWVDHRLLAK